MIYDFGYGVESDYEKALKYYEKAAELNHPGATAQLGNSYEYGRGVEQNHEKALEYYLKSYGLMGDDNSANKAVVQSKLINFYRFGLGTEQNYVKAFEYANKIEGLENATLFREIAWLYEDEDWFGHDEKKAFEYINKSYECSTNDRDKGLACRYIGLYYCDGIGVERNYETGYEWFIKGTEYNSATCYKLIGDLFKYGYGVEQDLEKAKEQYTIAIEKGCEYAADALASLENGDL